MYISEIVLKDWRAYIDAHFTFPEPTLDRNIILIGAPNGYGKTSLFEAIVLGMFGQSGLHLIARSPEAQSNFLSTDNSRPAVPYRKFIEKALYKGAIKAGRSQCSVKLTFTAADGELLTIERAWYFSDSGIYRPQDDVLNIYEGSDRKAVGPEWPDSDRAKWYSDYINANLLPPELAQFFMFDGEAVGELANRRKSAQVQAGIEGLLGIPRLRNLANDLRTYSAKLRTHVPKDSTGTIERLTSELEQLQTECDRQNTRLAEITPFCEELKRDRHRLHRELASSGATSQALLEEKFDLLKQYEDLVGKDQDSLEKIMVNQLAVALAGPTLREKTRDRLLSENERESWENDKRRSDNNLDGFLNSISGDIQKIDPLLEESQQQDVLKSARDAWEKLWYPVPENCAAEYRHPYLNARERDNAVENLDRIANFGKNVITDLVRKIERNRVEKQRTTEEIARTESITPHFEDVEVHLTETSQKIAEYDQEIGAVVRELTTLDAKIVQKGKELENARTRRKEGEPSSKRADVADRVIKMVNEIAQEAVPSQINAVAEAMTGAYRAMAHKKGIVDRITISDSCEVKLLDVRGEDLRTYDLSAGEEQIFTQALIYALSSVSNRGFPMVVDTPLGRLDQGHRKGVLAHLAERKHQVILLSTDTEVVGEYLAEIATHVQKKYLLQFDGIDGADSSTVRDGYFEEVEAQR